MSTTSTIADRQVSVTRVLNAPVERAFQAWTDPKHLDAWWGPSGFITKTEALDAKPGGAWRYTMTGADGKVWPNYISYQQVVPNQRLEYDHGTSAEDPAHFHVVVTFTEEAGRTSVTMLSTFPSVEALETVKKFGAIELGKQSMDKMMSYVSGLAPAALVIDRVLKAPLERVFKACTEAQHLAQWWGPKGFTMKVAKLDLRPGGVFHYSMLTPDGQEMWGKFDYVDVVPNWKIEFINSFSNAEGEAIRHPMAPTWPLFVHNVWTFSEQDGQTTIHMVGQPYEATAEETAMFEGAKANVQGGMKGTFDQLEAYLAQ
jgi:uncharacterized protein YndB with AHSA1/START domain